MVGYVAVSELGIPPARVARALGVSALAVTEKMGKGRRFVDRMGWRLDKLKSNLTILSYLPVLPDRGRRSGANQVI